MFIFGDEEPMESSDVFHQFLSWYSTLRTEEFVETVETEEVIS